MVAKSSTPRVAPEAKRQRMQELFLPVHGHVNLYREEIAIIDHPSFQRLRRVRQLGFAQMVFPGGVHTRLEHSIGAVHVAQVIIDHVNANFELSHGEEAFGDWRPSKIPLGVARLIRLGALLHDIGHLPFGHTLEDELNHLRPHDGPGRIEMLADRTYPYYELQRSIAAVVRPAEGWSLRALLDKLYEPVVRGLELDLPPFTVVCAIICKPPKQEDRRAAWEHDQTAIAKKIDLQVCRDIVGNTICADFLDYLFRDWHHLGKPLTEDKRLYQYMEVRAP